MSCSIKMLLVVAGAVAAVGCATARDPARGFRLAGNGDAARGKAAFVEFGCHQCHEVQGSRLPLPTLQRVRLGGSVLHQPGDGYLVTAIINPAYHAVRYPPGKDSAAGPARMPEFASRMTVQQLTDIVAYLQTRYALRPSPVPNEFP